jgi:Plasmid pRiA4b ORF-3-like protein
MEAAVVYRFHIALRSVSPKIWRRMELTAGSSLADLQRVIRISLGWFDEYQHRFCIRNHYLGTSRPGGLLFFGDPEAMTLSQFAFRLHERFTYEYNFFDAWLFVYGTTHDGFGDTWVIFNVEDPDRGADVVGLSFWIHMGSSHMTCNLDQRGRFRIAS